ncbi:hyccin [Culicoides brevitarsis]|uniref:hyccin n=1 Tax=Culicoides brevitarsis TaxID=469753 RepID=UPI00307C6D1D
MAHEIVSDWLQEYSKLEKDELKSFAANHENDHELSSALFTILSERSKYPDLIHAICNQLHSFYRSHLPELRRVALQFVPNFIYIYLAAIAQGERKSTRSIETLLISIYNYEISNEDGQPKVVSFRMPVLAQPSMYHEEKTLHATDLKRWEVYSNKDVTWGPHQPIESLNAQNRPKVMTALMFVYNQQLSQIQKVALYHLCKVSSAMVNQGFAQVGHAHRPSYGNDPSSVTLKPPPRIPMSSKLLLELLHATYFAMFNEFASAAIQTVDDIHNRACFEMFSDVILVTSAIRNFLRTNPSGQPSDGPMGISVALSPATTSVVMSKSMITNASFRTKKLPDDIPIQAEDAQGHLTSINEDGEPDLQNSSRNSTARASKDGTRMHKIGFSGLRKLKDKATADKKDKDSADGKPAVKNGVPPEVAPRSEMSLSKKLLEKKDKLIGKSSSLSQASMDVSEPPEKTSSSPLALLKRKSSSIDVTITTQPTAEKPEIANGNAPNDMLSPTYEFGDSFDSDSDINQTIASMQGNGGGDIKSQNMTVSQV